jgi:hypothetical protein
MCCWKKKIATVVLALAVLVPVIFPSTWVYAAPDDSSENGMTDNIWSAMDSGTTEDLYGVWGSSASDVFAVGWNGTILHYDGSTWTSTGTNSL